LCSWDNLRSTTAIVTAATRRYPGQVVATGDWCSKVELCFLCMLSLPSTDGFTETGIAARERLKFDAEPS